jgi:uncharacterized protein
MTTAITRAGMIRSLFTGLATAMLTGQAVAQTGKKHRVVLHVDQNDAAVMNMALNNAKNIFASYGDKHEDVEVEFVAYGPGLHMLREDTSPVKSRIKEMAEVTYPSKIVFSACNNTKRAMEAREGHSISIVAQATIVPAGVVRIMELEEQGYSYIKP